MRRRERDEVTEIARRRLELLNRELGVLAPEPKPTTVRERSTPSVGWLEEEPGLTAGPPAGVPGSRVIYAAHGAPGAPTPSTVRSPGRHALHRDDPHELDDLAPRVPGAAGWRRDLLDRVRLSGQHLVVLVGVLGLGLALAGWWALRHGGGEAVPQARFTGQQVSADAETSAGSTPPAGSQPSPGAGDATPVAARTVVVDVAGKVRRPGLVTLPAGSRVDDAIRRAGGPRPGADIDDLNLARTLVDGEQVLVGVPGATQTAPTGAPGTSSGASGTSGAAAGPVVDLNTADLSQLDTLPSVGPVTAQKILDWRTAHGSFTSVQQLLDVDGIGEKTLADIAPRATV